MRIASAQTTSVPGDISANIAIHKKFITAAHAANVDLLLFPELSLSGYELALIDQCALQPNDDALEALRDMAHAFNMTIVVGAPIANTNATPYIGAITFCPDGSTSIYCKQHLHPGEEAFATRCERGGHIHALFNEFYALAICADTSQRHHAASAAAGGASLYLASVLVSEQGYSIDAGNLQRYARTFNFGVLMANHGGPSGEYVAAGKSAFWAPGGELIAMAPGAGSVLVIATQENGIWNGELLTIKT